MGSERCVRGLARNTSSQLDTFCSAMPHFLEKERSLENYWRAVILFGQNVASYKFDLGKSLIELSGAGQSVISLEDLAEPSLRANIDETVLPVVITEQGENRNQCEEQRYFLGFSHGFACR